VEKLDIDLNSAQLFFDNLQDAIFLIALDNKEIVFANKAAQVLLEMDFDTICKTGIDNIREGVENKQNFDTHVKHLTKEGFVIELANVITASKKKIPVEAHAKVVQIQSRIYNLAIVRDITHRKEYESKLKDLNAHLEAQVRKKTRYLEKNLAFLESYKKVIDKSLIVSKSDLSGRITYANENFCKLTGYSQQEVLGKPHNIVRHPDTPKSVFKDMWNTILDKKTWQGLLKNIKKDGSHYWVDITIMPILDENNEISEFIGVRYDVTELIQSKERLESMAQTDTLTNYGNRFKLINDINECENPALALIDIDRFNEINDFYGSQIGDAVIIQFGQKLQEKIDRLGYSLYRLHGDQFAVLAPKSQRVVFADFIKDLNASLGHEKFNIAGKTIPFQTTATVSFETKDQLIATADMAKKYAKNKRLHFFIFETSFDFNKEYENNLLWTLKIKEALETDRIVPYFQGIYNNKTQKIEKYECLVRMIENGKVISPFFFLDTAKKSKQYLEITKRMIDLTFSEFSQSQYEFSLNLTLEDIESDEMTEYLFDAMKKHKIKKNQLVIEIVESEGIDTHNEKVSKFLRRLKNTGVKIAIDDFGTGYSNFIYLVKFQANYVKIDGSMIKNIDTDQDMQEIVKTIVAFARRMGMKTIAEFVSSQAIFETVQSLGIDYSQGFLLHEPANKMQQ
jgi:PAS domain S-box-containing protein/diguanylate cyclase (GGDEF)-like protein